MAYHDTSSEPREQVSWNMAASHAQHVHSLIIKLTNFYLKGNLGQWYWTLSATREMVNHELNEEERTRLDVLEKNCNLLHKQWEDYRKIVEDGHQPGEKLRKIKVDFSITVKKYQRQIMDLLKELGYFPSKEDRTRLSF